MGRINIIEIANDDIDPIIVENILHKPQDRHNAITISGISFCEIIKSPNVHVIETNYEIKNGSNITFNFGNFKYNLRNIQLHKSEGSIKTIESKYWQEIYIEK